MNKKYWRVEANEYLGNNDSVVYSYNEFAVTNSGHVEILTLNENPTVIK